MAVRKKIYFSTYIDTHNIITLPQNTNNNSHRYYIKIPFLNRSGGKTAIVIMQNPSNAGRIEDGRMLSDNTIYKVCDYLYKSTTPLLKEIVILNLMSIYGGQLKNVLPNLNSVTDLSEPQNNDVIKNTIKNADEDAVIIAAWGGPPDFKIPDGCPITKHQLHSYYSSRIQKISNYLQNKTVYRVGDLSSRIYPRHGSDWYDYDPLNTFEF